MTSWSEYFSVVPDPRRQSALTKHLLSDILGLALCAMLCGADDFVEMALCGRERLEFLRERLGFVLAQGVPSPDTLNRVFKRLDPSALEKCLLLWVQEWQHQHQRHLCIDGRAPESCPLKNGPKSRDLCYSAPCLCGRRERMAGAVPAGSRFG